MFKYSTELSRVYKNWIHSQLNEISVYQKSRASLEDGLSVLPAPKRKSVPSGVKLAQSCQLYCKVGIQPGMTSFSLPILRFYYSFGSSPMTDTPDRIFQKRTAWLWEVRPGRVLGGSARRSQEGQDQKPDCPSQPLRFP